ncbi:hypothetical protein F9L07_01915 [Pimelobacter simplex]|uniref:Uncharacterized protein n=1 Tax=Nocardioides simplex TaxID=2045 RepID=A0A7J5DXJ0_NOCSI|nr:hypothetical protein [Pimelobacter simplex]KAB2810736.1 hypothetical protein F9L07_01915 [Pimelobacter simplex]
MAAQPSATAADFPLEWTSTPWNYKYQGRWTDVTDTLCARTQGYRLRVRISPVGGSGPTFTVTTSGGGGGTWSAWACTGNLSIPEDVKYKMELITVKVEALDPPTQVRKSGTFFT